MYTYIYTFYMKMNHKYVYDFPVPPLELFRGAALALTSSIASKCVGPDELGTYTYNNVK